MVLLVPTLLLRLLILPKLFRESGKMGFEEWGGDGRGAEHELIDVNDVFCYVVCS